MTVNTQQETKQFQTEVKQLLNLMIHSLYTNKEIFLRELVSNASDALDKLRFCGLSDSKLYENDSDLKIFVGFDNAENTITIRDNGIGMTRDEAINHLGTIAKSGTKEFIQNLSGDESKDSNLIGQFGVGFYSAFLVADKVTVYSRRAGTEHSEGVMWESTGEGEYLLENIHREQRGTEIVLHLKNECNEFLSAYKLKSIINTYSDHISFPVEMEKMPEFDKEGNEVAVEGSEVVNKATALWVRKKSDITDAEYIEFYKHVSHDFKEPLKWTHNQVEGKYEYSSLLYIPSHAPFDMWNREKQYGVKLYVQRVFIMDDAEQFIPTYLRFIRGIIDCNDLPLNISREILQKNRLVDTIKAASTKKILGLLEKMTEDKEEYAKFWQEFGEVLKEGPAEDHANRAQIAKLLRFATTHGDAAPVSSFDDYISRMQEGQEKIYYITAESYAAAKNSPHLEIFRKKGIEVLLLSHRVDEWLVSHLEEVDGKKLQSVSKGAVDLDELGDEESKNSQSEVDEANKDFLERVNSSLGECVKEVRSTARLIDSPACIVVDENDMGTQMQRILKAAGQEMPVSKPILELNLSHPLIEKLNHQQDETEFKDWCELLFQQAVLADGGQLEDPAGFVARLNKLLLNS